MSGCLLHELSGLDTIRHQTSVESQLGAWKRDRFLKPPAVAARLCIDKSLVLSCLDIFCEAHVEETTFPCGYFDRPTEYGGVCPAATHADYRASATAAAATKNPTAETRRHRRRSHYDQSGAG